MARADWSPERWATVEMLCWRLADMPAAERAVALAEARRTDPEVALEVETLLTEWEADPDFLDTPMADVRTEAPEVPEGRRIGDFRIVRPLGQGGMGEVFLAVEESAGIDRFVALKLVRDGLDHAGLLERFHQERRVLASLDHPSIARLYQVGSTPDGRPYLVMEHVDGETITAFADGRGLAAHGRVRLFQQVCAGVQHAHLRLVVHRDLKPANVLVTKEGDAKLLDFGVAGVLEGEQSGRDEMRAATPAYAAPEQLEGDPPGTPADIFSLGVLLYELLAGRHPFPARKSGDVPYVEPPSAFRSDVSSDLDAIVLKAMSQDPERRYWTAAALSEDLDRALTSHPVTARPRTAGYVASRFIRRNAVAVSAGSALVVALVAFSAVTAAQSNRIKQESARVTQERDEALAVRSFLLESFGTTGPDVEGDAVTARQLLDGRAAVLDAEYGDDPQLHAEMLGVVAEGYERLGLFAEAEPLARASVDLRAADDPDRAAALATLGWIVHQAGRLEEAGPILQEAVATGRATYPEGHGTTARALNDFGVNREALGQYDEAEAAYAEALVIRRRLLGDDDAVVAVTASNLSVVRYRKGDLEGAASMAGEAHELFVRTLGPDHQRSMIVENNLAAMQAAAGETESARATYRDILERRRRIFGDRHPNTAQSMTALATMIPAGPGDAEASELLLEARSVHIETLGPDHPTVANTTRRLATVVARSQGPDEARVYFDDALRILRTVVGDDHASVGETLNLMAGAYADDAQPGPALPLYEEGLRIQRGALGPDHATTRRTEIARVAVLLDLERTNEAALALTSVWDSVEPNFPATHALVHAARLEFVRLHFARSEPQRADSVLRLIEENLTTQQRGLRIGETVSRYRAQIDATLEAGRGEGASPGA